MAKKCIDGSTLKLIAVITMLIDHLAAGVLLRYLQTDWTDTGYELYSLMRGIGRIAFPIFCFLLTEGFMHTKSRGRYALRMGVFALISEVPFDLLFRGRILETGYQNVFFTLLIGVCTMTVIDAIGQRQKGHTEQQAAGETPGRPGAAGVPAAAFAAAQIAAAVCGMALAQALRTDYAARGVMCMLVFYVFRKNRAAQIIAGSLAFVWWEPPALLAFCPIALYNGKRGRNIKYFFYLFYPVHLLLLYLLCAALGLA